MAGSGKDKTELDRAVDGYRGERGPEQVALPGLADPEGAEISQEIARRGRPEGSRNLRSEAYAALLIREAGRDPLMVATKIAAVDVTDAEQLGQLAKTWGCKPFDAVKLWATINRDVQPYLHQALPRAVVLNPGAPGGERVLMEIDGVYHEIDAEDEAA